MKSIFDHVLVPTHRKLNDKETEAVLKKYDVKANNLPKIGIKDVAIKGLDPEKGNVIEIKRSSLTAGESVYYRLVVEQ